MNLGGKILNSLISLKMSLDSCGSDLCYLERGANVLFRHLLTSYSVKVRLQSPEGLDAASFLYQSLQAYDFLRLYQSKKCQLQVFRLLYQAYFFPDRGI